MQKCRAEESRAFEKSIHGSELRSQKLILIGWLNGYVYGKENLLFHEKAGKHPKSSGVEYVSFYKTKCKQFNIL